VVWFDFSSIGTVVVVVARTVLFGAVADEAMVVVGAAAVVVRRVNKGNAGAARCACNNASSPNVLPQMEHVVVVASDGFLAAAGFTATSV
jgi:hypothetical protein